MIETLEQIEQTLSLAGEDLVFLSFIIKGIPGHLVYNIQSFDSPFDIYKQDFSFQISAKAFKAYSISSGDNFTYSQGTSIYQFSVKSYELDLLGWVNLRVNLEVVSDV